MGGSQSREGLEISDSEAEEEEEEDRRGRSAGGAPSTSYESPGSSRKISTLDDAEARLRSLSLKYASSSPSSEFSPATTPNAAKLYLHVGGSAPDARWIVSEKLVSYSFRKSAAAGGAGSSDGESDDDGDESASWFLEVGSKIRVRIDPGMQLKTFPEQRRVDFVAAGVWAMKFFSAEAYTDFYNEYQNCFFENMYGMEANEENKMKIYGKEFMGWAKPELADDTMWEDAEESFEKKPPAIYSGLNQDLLKQFEEVATDDGGGIQSLALGALDNSFLVSDSGIQVVKNFSHGIHGKGITVKLAKNRSSTSASSATPTKALLMKAETNMLVMSPGLDGQPRSAGVQQVDIETGKAVGEWKFEKDGTGIRMRDITNDSKAAQLDPSESTFLGLDDNALCRWDMRERKGKVQRIANAADSPVMEWTQGHHFSRGTDFLSFAATGDGSIAVGSRDGRIRLYSKSSMRTAKTAFPGLGSPITHVDVTYDGRWILGTTDSYLVLICTVFKDKEGKEKTGFSGRMGNRIAAPRLLKLSPLDAQQAGQNKFKGGHFSWVTEGGKQERHVVATMGKVSVVWSFARVKDGQHKCYKRQQGLKSCYCYKVVPREESIVDSRFMHDNFAISEAPLVVATPLKVSSFTLSPT